MMLIKKSMWISIAGVALVALLASGALMWVKHNRGAVREPAILESNSIKRVETNPALDDREEAKPVINEKASKQDFDRALVDINNKMAAMRSQLVQLKQAQGSKPSHNTGSTETPTQDSEAAVLALTPEEEVWQAETQARAQESLIEETFFTEKADSEWVQASEAVISDVFQNEEVKALKLVNAECRTTVCRVEVSLNDAEDPTLFEENFRKLMLFTPWQGPAFGRVDNPEGQSPMAVLYVGREGYPLPQPTN